MPIRPVTRILEARPRDLGGFTVRRILPVDPRVLPRRMVGPFIFLDHMGPAHFPAGGGVDVRPHPHIGLATVTWLFDGALLHRDSLGSVQVIIPGEVNWMIAGRGIVHSERTPPGDRAGGARLHGMQCWVALHREAEETEPLFEHLPARALPGFDGDGIHYRVIAGTAFGLTAPVAVHSPLGYAAIHLQAGRELAIPPEHSERALYVAEGSVDAGEQTVETGQLALLKPRVSVALRAREDCRVMLVAGEPLEGPRHIWWNFVSSSEERVARARADWREGRFPAVPGETEFIPLPPD